MLNQLENNQIFNFIKQNLPFKHNFEFSNNSISENLKNKYLEWSNLKDDLENQEQKLKTVSELIEIIQNDLITDHNNIFLKKILGLLLLNRAILLFNLEKHENIMNDLNLIHTQFKDYKNDEDINDCLAQSLVLKSKILQLNGNNEESIKIIDEFLRRFKNNQQVEIQKLVSINYRNRIVTLKKYLKEQNDAQKIIKIADQIDKEFKNQTDFIFRKIVAEVLFYKANIVFDTTSENYNNNNKNNIKKSIMNAIEIYNQIDRRYKNNKETVIREIVAESLENKVYCYFKLHKKTQVDAIIKIIENRYQTNESPNIQDIFIRLIKFKQSTLN